MERDALGRRMANDSILKAILTKGVEIAAVAHAGRNIRAAQRTALECRDPECIVPGCEIRRGLQIDHRPPYVETRHTSVEALARLCRWHHYQKSHCGYTYLWGRPRDLGTDSARAPERVLPEANEIRRPWSDDGNRVIYRGVEGDVAPPREGEFRWTSGGSMRRSATFHSGLEAVVQVTTG